MLSKNRRLLELSSIALLTTTLLGCAYYSKSRIRHFPGGHAYKLYDSEKTWSEAKRACEVRNGHLVTINSESEHGFVVQHLLARSSSDVWIGARLVGSGQWRWVTHESWSYAPWCPGAPGTVRGGVVLSPGQGGCWNHGPRGPDLGLAYFICEWDDPPEPAWSDYNWPGIGSGGGC